MREVFSNVDHLAHFPAVGVAHYLPVELLISVVIKIPKANGFVGRARGESSDALTGARKGFEIINWTTMMQEGTENADLF